MIESVRWVVRPTGKKFVDETNTERDETERVLQVSDGTQWVDVDEVKIESVL